MRSDDPGRDGRESRDATAFPVPHAASVRAPCSTSNLGPGFDTLGLALDRYLRATFTPDLDGAARASNASADTPAKRIVTSDGALTLVRSGTLHSLEGAVEDDHLVGVFIQVLAEAGIAPRGTVRVASEIPVARGLGSSAAAFVAGHALARAALGQPVDQAAAFHEAFRREGHGDNAAPCALGGFRAVVPGEDGPTALALPLSEEVGFAYAAPAQGVSTAAARAALPRQVTHEVAVGQLGRITMLMRGLAEADPDLIRLGIADELHVPHRLPLIPGAFNALGAGYDAGAWAVTISGSGSGLIALCPPDVAPGVADAMRAIFDAGAGDPGCVGFALRPDVEGVVGEGET